MSETKTSGAGADVPRARQTTETEPPAQQSKGFLGFVERAGDRIPHPALMFLILCGIVIVLSQILYLAGVHSTSEVAVPPPSQAQYVEEGGSTVPAYDIPPAPGPAAYHIVRRLVPARHPARARRAGQDLMARAGYVSTGHLPPAADVRNLVDEA